MLSWSKFRVKRVDDGVVTRVILVRHGQSEFNAARRFQGSLDEPRLTAKGWKTAVACGEYLSKADCDVILCSTLKRARQTAEGIHPSYRLRRVNPPIIYDARLREVHLPGWEGLSIDSIRDRYPAAYETWKESPERLVLPLRFAQDEPEMPSFSPLGDVKERVWGFWNDLLLERSGQQVLIVGHGAAISAMLAVALNLPVGIIHRVQQSNGGVSCLEFTGRALMSARALYINRTQHLGEILPKMKEGRTGLRVLLLTEEHAARICWGEVVPGGCVDVMKGERSADIVSALMNETYHEVRTVAWIQPSGYLSAETLSWLRLDAWKGHGVAIREDRLTVLHYPRPGCNPILQAMNIDLAAESN